jgi:IS30 family transposase
MPKAYHHLTRDQRCQIYALKRRGLAQTKIAVDIGVSQGTISRELTRNKGFRGYRYLQAHRFAVQRGSARKGVAHVMTDRLIVRVKTFLCDNQWEYPKLCVLHSVHAVGTGHLLNR